MNEANWKPFDLELIAYNFFDSMSSQLNLIVPTFSNKFSELYTGFTFSLWFQQSFNNNGTLLHMIRDDNKTIVKLTVKSSSQKIYFSYYCPTTRSNLCSLEIDTGNLFINKNNKANFFVLRVITILIQ
jgi:hypothetical protein